MEQNPSTGRDVHYMARGSADGVFPPVCRTAKITEVDRSLGNDLVGLCVFNPTGLFFHSIMNGGVVHDEETKAPGTWHWPERV